MQYISLSFSKRELISPYEWANRYYRAYRIISSTEFPNQGIVKMKLEYAGQSKDNYWDEIDIVLQYIRSAYVNDDFQYAGEIKVASKKGSGKLFLNDFYHYYSYRDYDDLMPEYI